MKCSFFVCLAALFVNDGYVLYIVVTKDKFWKKTNFPA